MADPAVDLEIRPVTPDDWKSHRDLRLEMLQDAPDAFWTQYADVADLHERAWRERIAAQQHFQARLDGEPVGSVGIWADPGELGDGTLMLIAMYVSPRARGRRVGERLVARVLEEAARRGCATVALEVTSNNAAAIGLYRRMGFSFNGRRQPHPRREDLEELGMEWSAPSLRPASPRTQPGGPDMGGSLP